MARPALSIAHALVGEWDAADCYFWVVTFVLKLHHFFNDAAVWDAQGYTRHMLAVLENNRFGVVVNGDSRAFGGSPVPQAVKRRHLRELQAWVVMVGSILATEFPRNELLSSVMIFELRLSTHSDLEASQGASREAALRRLAKVCGVSAHGLLQALALCPASSDRGADPRMGHPGASGCVGLTTRSALHASGISAPTWGCAGRRNTPEGSNRDSRPLCGENSRQSRRSCASPSCA